MSTAPSTAVRVLHVDDDPDFLDLTRAYLERAGLTVETTTTVADARELVDSGGFDCVVSDYDMPGATGIEFLETVRETHPDLPFILFTGKGSEEVASDAISAGVTDYLQKGSGTDQYAVLVNRVTNAVEHARSRRLVEQSERRLREIVDALPDLLYVVDESGRYLLANRRVAEFHDTTVEAVEGATVEDVLGESAASAFRDHLEDALDADGTQRYPAVELDGPDGTRVLEPRLRPYEFEEDRAVLGIASDVTEREENASALERARERVQLALEHTSAVVFEIDLETDEVTRYGTYERTFGEHPDDAPTWREHAERVVHPEDRERFREFHRQLIDGDLERDDIEYRTAPDHGDRWIHARVHAATDESGARRAVGISQDVTDRKEREEELERTNALLSRLFSTLPVGVLAEDGDREVLAANQRLVDLFGVDASASALVGADCRQLAADASDLFADPDAFRARVESVVADRDPVRDETLALADGRTYTRSYQPVDLGDDEGHLWMYRDVSDRAEHESRLESLNETTRALLGADSREEVARLGVDAAADVLRLDASAVHLYDPDRDALVPVAATDTIRDLVGEPPTFERGEGIAWRVFESGTPATIDDVHADPDTYNPDTPVQSELVLPVGDTGVMLAGSPSPAAFDHQDQVLGELLAGNIATALEQVERTAELRERERELTRQNDRLAEFASIVSHDLRSPLSVAKGRVDLARAEDDTSHLGEASSALDRMNDLIEDLLMLAREGDEPDLEPVDLAALARTSWGHVETGDGTLVTDTSATIRADRGRLQQLLENLLSNSIGHGGDGVTVTVGALEDGISPSDEPGTDASRGDSRDAARTGFYVADDGPGIPPDEREAVFELGHSTSNVGAGFGLSIVRRVADAHDWTVSVTESADGGARFELRGVEFD